MPTKTPKRHVKRPAKETVLVTGATGRLGHRLSRELLKSGVTVRALINLHEHATRLPPGTIPFVGDITDQGTLRTACEGVDTIYHFAAIVSQHKFGPKEIMRVNSLGTTHVLEAAEHAGARHLIFPSSVDVYGSNRSEVLTEDAPLKPNDMYGHSKMVAERQIVEFGGTTGSTIFRTATIYGKGFENSFFKVFKLIKSGKGYLIGSAKNNLALIHIDDVVRAMLLAKDAKPRQSIYNLADGRPHTQESLMQMAAELLGAPIPRKHVSTVVVRLLARQIGLDADELRFVTSNRLIDIARIRKELGFNPRVTVRSGAKELADEFLKHYKNMA